MEQVLKDLSVIVPTYNEKNNMPFLLYMLRRELSTLDLRFEVIVVDDNSPDGTREVVERLGRLLKLDLNLVKRPGKMGLGSSYVEGLKHAKYDFVLIMDADLSHHPKYIPKMVKLQRKSNFDVVSGTRYSKGGGASGWPFKRVFISKSLNYVCKVLFRPSFSDLTGSFRLYRKSLLKAVVNRINSKGFMFQVEMALKCERYFNARVGEVPIVFVERLYGSSKLDFNELKRGVVGLLKLMWEF